MFALEPAEWMYNPIGMVHGGIAATILDSCMGCAVHTTLAAGVGRILILGRRLSLVEALPEIDLGLVGQRDGLEAVAKFHHVLGLAVVQVAEDRVSVAPDTSLVRLVRLGLRARFCHGITACGVSR